MIPVKAKHPLVRAAALAAAVAFVCAGIAQLLHRAEEVHAVCAEHGEQLHLEQTAGDFNPAGALDSAPDLAHGDEHEHCGLCPSARHAVAPVTHSTNIEAPKADLEIDTPAVTNDRPAAVAVYRTAPKASPPSFA